MSRSESGLSGLSPGCVQRKSLNAHESPGVRVISMNLIRRRYLLSYMQIDSLYIKNWRKNLANPDNPDSSIKSNELLRPCSAHQPGQPGLTVCPGGVAAAFLRTSTSLN